MTTTAQIAGKGCTGTGITEEIAKALHDQLGKTIVIVAEVTSTERTEKRDGDESVKLSIGNLEVAPDGLPADHVRELSRSFHYERKLAEDGPTLTGSGDGIEPKVSDVLEAGQRHRPHPYIASTLSTDDDAVCDVCGSHEGATVHDPAQRPTSEDDSQPALDQVDDDTEADPAT